ncbi:MAG: hypothetical protein IT243_08955 [Bacteroidia bacterium]|nr:hypothetical protein [Bacteroidia bacterium]
MYRIVLLSITVFSFILSYSQKYIKPYIGVNFSSRIMDSQYELRKDSLDKADKIKKLPCAGVILLFEKKSGREFYFGVAYNESGFERQRLNYKFQDTVHPQLGQIHDLSQAAQKNGYFTYHFKYLEFPTGYNIQITPRQEMHRFTGWFNIGLNPQFLIKQNMTIFLQGFTMKGKNKFNLSNTGYNAAKVNVALQTGGRFDVNIKNKFWVTSDALFKINLNNNAENSFEKLRIWYLSLNIGIRYEIGSY